MYVYYYTHIIRKIPLLNLSINLLDPSNFVFSKYRGIETVYLANSPVIARVYFFSKIHLTDKPTDQLTYCSMLCYYRSVRRK